MEERRRAIDEQAEQREGPEPKLSKVHITTPKGGKKSTVFCQDGGSEGPEPKRKKLSVAEALAEMMEDADVMGVDIDDANGQEEAMAEDMVCDSRSGAILDSNLVAIARKEELDFMIKVKLYEEVPEEQC